MLLLPFSHSLSQMLLKDKTFPLVQSQLAKCAVFALTLKPGFKQSFIIRRSLIFDLPAYESFLIIAKKASLWRWISL